MGKILLIAEQDKELTDIYLKYYSREGLNILVARNGVETIEVVERCKPNLLLMSLILPRLSGFDVLEYIRKKKYRLPVIILSHAMLDSAFRETSLKLGAVEYLTKEELTLKTLRPVIEKYLRIKKGPRLIFVKMKISTNEGIE